MDELKCMRAFVKVVEVGSFSEAARQTHTTKSVITKRINQLEDYMQLELIQRSTRKLTITDTGSDYYERCVRILSELDEAKAMVNSIEWGLTGTFRISCISSFLSAYLADDICEFHKDHPDLHVELLQHDRFCDPVQEGFDICLQTPTSISRGILEVTDVIPTRRIIVATPDYLEKYGKPRLPEDIKSHRFAHNIYVQPKCSFDFVKKDTVTTVPFDPIITTNTIWLLRSAVLHNECMSMMPLFFIEKELLTGEMVPVLSDYRLKNFYISAYYRRSAYVPMKIRIFLNFLHQKYGTNPPWEYRLLKKFPKFSSLIKETI